MAKGGAFLYDLARATKASVAGMNSSIPMYGYERIANYLNPGGLVAIAAPRRDRDALWRALMDRHVYGTSGARIGLWVRAEVTVNGAEKIVEMGDITTSSQNPVFHLKANGAFREDGTCRYDEHPEIQAAMSLPQFQDICFSQCYEPLDQRTPINRIEVVKVRQPLTIDESKMADLKWSPENPDGLIIDPYATFEFHEGQVEWTWTDPVFEREARGRSVAYYFRVIQEPTEGYNCNPTARLEAGKTCDNGEPGPKDVGRKANPQDGAAAVARDQLGDACYSDRDDQSSWCQERAWSSPVYVVKE